MARKLDKDGQSPAAPKGAAGANDLEVLRPDLEVQVGARILVMREYRFWEGLQLEQRHKAFFEDLYALFDRGRVAPGFDDVADLLAMHQDSAIAMVAQACTAEPEWVAGLDDRDGDKLMVTWWVVNANFFIRRVMRRAAKAHVARANPPDGPASSTSSLPAGTSEHPTTSPS
jgi:hypothetical protein